MPEDKKSPILVYVTHAERAELEKSAEENSRSTSAEGRAAIRAWLAAKSD